MIKVGDIVTGTEASRNEYRVTNDEATMQVINMSRDNRIMTVKLLKHKRLMREGDTFSVQSQYFKLSDEMQDKDNQI